MHLIILFLLIAFVSAITYVMGFFAGSKDSDKRYADKVCDQGLLSLEADIVKIRATHRMSALERKSYGGGELLKRIEWNLTRDLVDHLYRSDLIKRKVERVTPIIPTGAQEPLPGADTVYTYEIAVINPDTFS